VFHAAKQMQSAVIQNRQHDCRDRDVLPEALRALNGLLYK